MQSTSVTIDRPMADELVSARDLHLLANTWMPAIFSAPAASIAGSADEMLKSLLAERYLGLPVAPPILSCRTAGRRQQERRV